MKTRHLLAAASLLALTACGSAPATTFAESARLGVRTETADGLRDLPPLRNPLDVAVYTFLDQTGQHRPNSSFAEYSFAVTQGGASILLNALMEAGRGTRPLFRVLERNRVSDLFQERQIIRANRSEHPGPDGRPLPPLGPLRNAGLIITGGIISYDTNMLTGGFGASFLGIGGATEYRRDSVSIYLRVVSVLSGEILASVTTDKTIYSFGLNGSANRYVGFNRLLQIEGGVTTNEPKDLAVRQAIEKAVHALIVEGASKSLWSFADEARGRALIREYQALRDGTIPLPPTAETPPGGPIAGNGAREGGAT